MQKEQYFTLETIDLKAQELLASVAGSRHRHFHFQPEKAALLVLDLQEYFLQERSHAYLPSAASILPGIFKLIAAFTSGSYPVIATRHVNTPENAGMMAKWWRALIEPQSAYSHNIALIGSTNIIYLNKSQYDAFYNTPLEATLKEKGIGQVVICGVMTHLCCETTARAAFTRGFEVLFTVDGTATYNEQLHRASLLTLSHGFAVPVLIDALLRQMETHED